MGRRQNRRRNFRPRCFVQRKAMVRISCGRGAIPGTYGFCYKPLRELSRESGFTHFPRTCRILIIRDEAVYDQEYISACFLLLVRNHTYCGFYRGHRVVPEPYTLKHRRKLQSYHLQFVFKRLHAEDNDRGSSGVCADCHCISITDLPDIQAKADRERDSTGQRIILTIDAAGPVSLGVIVSPGVIHDIVLLYNKQLGNPLD